VGLALGQLIGAKKPKKDENVFGRHRKLPKDIAVGLVGCHSAGACGAWLQVHRQCKQDCAQFRTQKLGCLPWAEKFPGIVAPDAMPLLCTP